MRGRARAALAGAGLLAGLCCAVPAAAAEDGLVIGDSITVAARSQFEAAGYTVNAAMGRTFSEGVDLLRQLAPDLPSRVVVNLGSNSGVTSLDCFILTEIVGPDRDLTLVTVNIPQYPDIQERSNRILARCAESARARLVDWAAYSKSNPAALCPDGLHVSCGGAPVYAAFVMTGMTAIERPAEPLPDSALPPPAAPDASFFERGLAGAARAAAQREAEAAEAARVAAAVEVARAAAQAEADRVAAEQAAVLERLRNYRPAKTPAELDVIVSRENYGFRSVADELSEAASAGASPSN